MDKLKLLFITKDFTNFIDKSTFYLIEELRKLTDLMIWSNNGHIDTIIKEAGFTPDFILLNDFKSDYSPQIQGLKYCSIPNAIIMHDLHYKRSSRKKFIEKEKINHIFSIYRDKFHEWYPEYSSVMTWLPHHVPTSIFKDYQLEKNHKFLLMGSTFRELYPLRYFIVDQLKGNPDFVHYPHPGYDLMDHKKLGYKVQKEYAQEINRSRIFFTCDSNFHFPVLKYFEVLGCRTLLLASGSRELKDLGFIDGKTFVEINSRNFMEKANYYLNEEKISQEIVTNGAKLIEERHSTKIRAKELLQHIMSLINEEK
ncbi:glycosyltransferase [Guptibacillus spartinae]|uniref:glycosyltransferase n=1 Tax=Guptibacillus spartinae TaxID=3025679 RepID=UPI0023602C48|nr:glycosyltransferase [Pseudalkalibacillus spartinae]